MGWWGVLAGLTAATVTLHYSGTIQDRAQAVVTLETANVAGGHAAVWEGASNRTATRWVQAGVADVGGRVIAYVETQRGIDAIAWKFAIPLTVRVTHYRHRWTVTARSAGRVLLRRSLWFKKQPSVLATLETTPGATAVALINGHRVRGR